jgi:signal recognition particle receptor subunit alpha
VHAPFLARFPLAPSRPVVEEKPQDADEIAKNLQALKAKLKGSPAGAKKGGAGGGGSKAGSGAASPGGSSGAETPTKRTKSAGSKVMRKWGDSSSSITDSDMAALDFSSPPPPTSSLSPPADSANLDELVSKEAMGTRGKDGLYDVADLDTEEEDDDDEEGLDGLGAGKEDDVDAMIIKALAKSRLKTAAAAAKSSSSLFKRSPLNPDADEDVAKASSSSSSTMSSFFSRLTGSKVLTKEDLAPVLEAMEKHLMGKNVAKEIAEKMCEGVEKSLVGKKLAGFGSTSSSPRLLFPSCPLPFLDFTARKRRANRLRASCWFHGLTGVKAEVRTSLSQSITRILTPKSSTDILLEIKRKQQLHLSNLALSPTTTTTTTSSSSPTPTDPYKMVFIGVNGVGKSTNLSKVCFWLLQNGLRVLIAACDTFRSGAVEQLRVHVRNLGLLGDKATTGTDGEGEGKGKVELFERGYGKDSAGIAKEAIAYGSLLAGLYIPSRSSDGVPPPPFSLSRVLADDPSVFLPSFLPFTLSQPKRTPLTSSSSTPPAGCKTTSRSCARSPSSSPSTNPIRSSLLAKPSSGTRPSISSASLTGA